MPPSNPPPESSLSSALPEQSSMLRFKMMLLKQPMIETPVRDRRFDPQELMYMDLIKTPQNYIEHLHDEFINPFQDEKSGYNLTASSSGTPTALELSKLDPPRRMICHRDFPLLLALRRRMKIVGASTNISGSGHPITNNDVDAIAMAMKQRRGLENFTINRGQCPLTDQLMRKYIMDALTKNYPNNLRNAKVGSQNRMHSATNQPHKISTKPFRNDEVSNSDLVAWADDFLKSSCDANEIVENDGPGQKKTPKVYCTEAELLCHTPIVSNTRSVRSLFGYSKSELDHNQGKKRRAEKSIGPLKRKRRCARKSLRTSSLDNGKKGKDSMDPICSSSLNTKPSAESKATIPSASSPTQTIKSDVAIALTPHPFKHTNKLMDELAPPSVVAVQATGPLSEMSLHNGSASVLFRKRTLAAPVPTPRTLQFPSLNNNSSKAYTEPRTNESDRVTLEHSNDKPRMSMIKEEIEESESCHEVGDTHSCSGKENNKTTESPPLPILSVAFL